jgi:CheY-like chemotaxis protein
MGKSTVLIVDDSEFFARSLVLVLESRSRTALAATNARDALDLLDANPDIDVIVTDVRMPGMDGVDFARVVRHRFPHKRVALMTAWPPGAADELPAGFPVLRKPFDIEALLALMPPVGTGD